MITVKIDPRPILNLPNLQNDDLPVKGGVLRVMLSYMVDQRIVVPLFGRDRIDL